MQEVDKYRKEEGLKAEPILVLAYVQLRLLITS